MVVTLGAVAALIAIAPPVADRADHHPVLHYIQHAIIFCAALAVGVAIRDAVATRLLDARAAVAVAGAALIVDAALVLPIVDEAIEQNRTLHETQHGFVVLCGLAMGVALRDVLVHHRRGRPPRSA